MTYITRDQVERLLGKAAAKIANTPADRSFTAAFNALNDLLHGTGADCSGRPAKVWLQQSGLHRLGDVETMLNSALAVAEWSMWQALLDELDDVESAP